MPYKNEHACRLRDPAEFEDGSFRRIFEHNEWRQRIGIIIGKLNGGETTTAQSLRYAPEDWSESDARYDCEEYRGGTFEAALPDMRNVSLEARIVAKSEAERVVIGPALIPGEPDADGEELSAEKIRSVAIDFMERSRYIDVEHSLKEGGTPVTSDLLRFPEEHDGEVYPAGTWMLGVKVARELWPDVMSGALKGFSIMGVSREVYESALSANKGALPLGVRYDEGELRKTLLQDLGPDWVVAAVSLLKTPAVKRSRFIVVKSDKESWLTRLFKSRSNKGKETEPETENEIQEDTEMTKEEILKAVSELPEEDREEILKTLAPAPEPEPAPEPDPVEPTPPPAEPASDDANAELKAEVEALKGQLSEQSKIIDKVTELAEASVKSQKLSLVGSGKADNAPGPDIKRDIWGRRSY